MSVLSKRRIRLGVVLLAGVLAAGALAWWAFSGGEARVSGPAPARGEIPASLSGIVPSEVSLPLIDTRAGDVRRVGEVVRLYKKDDGGMRRIELVGTRGEADAAGGAREFPPLKHVPRRKREAKRVGVLP